MTTSYRNYPTNLPFFTDKFTAGGRLNAYSDVFDALYADSLTATETGLTSICDPSALNSHGINYDLPRNSSESDIVYRSRLKQAFEIWKKAGSDDGIQLALQWLGINNANIVHWQDLVDRGVIKAFGGQYHVIAGANANGGLRFLHTLDDDYDVNISVGNDTALFVTILDNVSPKNIQISLQGAPNGSVLSTAADVIKLLRDEKIDEKTGVIFDYTGTGLGLAGVGTANLSKPIYSHFFVEIDQPNPYQISQNWNDTSIDKIFDNVVSPTTNDLNAISGLTPVNIVAVGNAKVIYFDDEKWKLGNPPTTDNFLCVSQHGFIGGAAGKIIKRINSNQTDIYNNSGTPFGAISINGCYSTSDTSAWFALPAGVIGNFNGAGFSTVQTAVTDDFYAIWGTSATNIWAVGDNGVIFNYDGATWTQATSPTTKKLYAIHGLSASLIYAVGQDGTIVKYNGTNWTLDTSATTNDLRSVYVTAASQAQACGLAGTIIYFDGNTWFAGNSGTNSDLRGIYAFLPDDLWVVGAGGKILRKLIKKFEEMTIPSVGVVRSLWVVSDTDVWAGCVNGKILHYDGKTWTQVLSPLVPTSINDMSLIEASVDGFLVGTNGKIWYYKPFLAPFFTKMESGTDLSLYGVTAITNTDVWAVGANGIILHYDGVAWQSVATPTSQPLYAIWALDANTIYAVGANGTIIKYNGVSWITQSSGSTSHFYGVSGDSSRVVAVGAAGASVLFNGVAWIPSVTGTTEDLYSITIRQLTRVGWACGSNGTVLTISAANVWAAETSGVTVPLYKIKNENSTGLVYAVGGAGTALIRNTLGTWLTQATGTTQNIVSVDVKIWSGIVQGCAGTDLGLTLRYNNTWSTFLPTGYAATLGKFWGSSATDIWCVTGTTLILHYDGVAWDTSTLPIPANNMALGALNIFGWDKNNVIATGSGGYIAKFDGANWAQATSPTSETLNAVWGISPTNYFVAGNNGAFYFYDGNSYSAVAGIANDFRTGALWGFNAQSIYAVGNDTNGGVILKYNGTTWTSITIPASLVGVSFTASFAQDVNRLYIYRADNTVILYDGVGFTPLPMEKYYNYQSIAGSSKNIYLGGALTNGTGEGHILQLIPDRFANVWNGGGTWDFFETIEGITDDIKAAIRKFKASGTSCRFLRINIAGKWVTVPVGELAEIDTDGNYITKDYLFDW